MERGKGPKYHCCFSFFINVYPFIIFWYFYFSMFLLYTIFLFCQWFLSFFIRSKKNQDCSWLSIFKQYQISIVRLWHRFLRVLPATSSPLRRSSAICLPLLFCRVLRSGRAPISGSYPWLASNFRGWSCSFKSMPLLCQASNQWFNHNLDNFPAWSLSKPAEDHLFINTVDKLWSIKFFFKLFKDSFSIFSWSKRMSLAPKPTVLSSRRAVAPRFDVMMIMVFENQPCVPCYLSRHRRPRLAKRTLKRYLGGLLYLIKEEHWVRFVANLLGQLPTFLAHIARRSSIETASRKFLHIFTHIKADKGWFVIKENFCQKPWLIRSYRHPSVLGNIKEPIDACGCEYLTWLRRIARLILGNSLILANDTFVQLRFQVQVFLASVARQLELGSWQAAQGESDFQVCYQVFIDGQFLFFCD